MGFILSGHQGLKVWFLPVPLANYGQTTVFCRKCELTGTKFTSVWKAGLVLVPFILICSILFANFIWSMAPIPSDAYPFAQRIWEFNAMKQAMIYSATVGAYTVALFTVFGEETPQQRPATGIAYGMIFIGWLCSPLGIVLGTALLP